MERTRVRKLPRFLVPALVVIAALVAVYFPVRSRMAASGSRQEAPARGTALSIFVTNQLVAYREPCG
jgi:hypothetical protein